MVLECKTCAFPISPGAASGFGVPVSRWLRREMSGFLRETLLSESTYSRMEGLVAAERTEPIRIKGFSQPVPVYRMTLPIGAYLGFASRKES